MTRTTALATALLLAAFPAAAQPILEGLVPETSHPATNLLSSEGVSAHYSGPVIGLPSLTDTRPSAAGDLAAPGFLIITEPTVRLNHLDFGAYEPYAPQRSREALKGISAARPTSPMTGDGINDVAVNVDGTLGHTELGTSYSTTSGPIDVRAKAGVVVPGVGEEVDAATFLRATDLRLDMKYKF